jgi:site-specific recombinase XerC
MLGCKSGCHSHGLGIARRADVRVGRGRHDYGTRILKHTGNLAAVMKAMGQKDVKTAMQYQHPEFEMVRAALNESASTAASGRR